MLEVGNDVGGGVGGGLGAEDVPEVLVVGKSGGRVRREASD